MERQLDFETPYDDRTHAGRVLADRLGAYRGKDVLVLGIPRGGVPVAAEVARRLDADLDVVVARKLGAPDQPELAIGAVTANGGEFLNEEILRAIGASGEYLERARKEQIAEARRREARFRGDRPIERIEGRVVVLVDDGLATGATMRAAVRSVRKHQPARLIVAVPVGSREACDALRSEADEVVCPSIPEYFGAVGYFYRNFDPTEDAEVERILRGFAASRATEARPPKEGRRDKTLSWPT
jgi:predicted phosphoribosyltransferase